MVERYHLSFPTLRFSLEPCRLHTSHRLHLQLLWFEEAKSPDIQEGRVAFVARCWPLAWDVLGDVVEVGLAMWDSWISE
jgi:hypothetical protein